MKKSEGIDAPVKGVISITTVSKADVNRISDTETNEDTVNSCRASAIKVRRA
jgi:hypothetical protein